MKRKKPPVMPEETVDALAVAYSEAVPPEQKKFAASLCRAYLNIVFAEAPPDPETQQRHIGLLLDMATEYHKLFVEGVKTEFVPRHMEEVFPHIQRGVKVLQGARLGHEGTHGKQAEKDARWTAMVREVERLRSEHPHLSNSRHQVLAAKNLKCSKKTIQRALNRMGKS